MVILEQSAEPLPADDLAGFHADFRSGGDERVVEALVISFPLTMDDEFRCDFPQCGRQSDSQ